MDEDGPVSGSLLEKAWAVAGLLAGAALIFMAVDLLRPQRPEAPGDN
ncbi:MAG TPA: hypothetical protein VGG50_07355 [Streptosporangiaceae bacterium]|jgi:hypothetical protein